MILQNGMENTKYWLENEVKIMKFKKIIKWTEIMNLMDNDEKIKLFKPNGMPINDLLWHDIYFQKKLGKEKKIFFFDKEYHWNRKDTGEWWWCSIKKHKKVKYAYIHM